MLVAYHLPSEIWHIQERKNCQFLHTIDSFPNWEGPVPVPKGASETVDKGTKTDIGMKEMAEFMELKKIFENPDAIMKDVFI